MSKSFKLALSCTALLCAQDDAACTRMLESKRQVTAYPIRKADEITARAAREMATAESWKKARPKRLWPARTPLNAGVTSVLDNGSCTVEKITFESMPEIDVT